MADEVNRVVILGSGPAGLTAALYASRANLNPLLIEGIQPGGQLTITTDVENYPGFEHGIQGPEMMEVFRRQAARFGTRFIQSEASAANLRKRPFELTLDDGQTIKSRALIISTGASAKLLGHRIREAPDGLRRKRVRDLRRRAFQRQGSGGGRRRRHRDGRGDLPHQVLHEGDGRSSPRVVARLEDHAGSGRKNPKIAFIWDSVIEEINGERKTGVSSVRLKNVKTGKTTDFKTDAVFMAIGHKPNTDLFRGQLEMNEQGYLLVKPGSTYTNIEGVFAAGDVADHIYRQAVTAAGTGCMAAIDAERWLEEHGE